MKIDFAMIVFNGEPFISLNLENIYSFANKIIIIEGPVLHYQKLGIKSSTDNTINIIKNFPDPDKKIILESGLWNEKDDMLKAQEKYFDGDWAWVPDADEFWKTEDMENIIRYLDSHSNCYSMSFNLLSFPCFTRYIGGFEAEFETYRLQRISQGAKWITHRPPTLSWGSSGKTCKEMGHVNGTKELGAKIYHYSHMPPKRMEYKSRYYKQLSTSILPDYFEKIYVPWLKAETDEERLEIEKRNNGFQEFKATCRTEAFTKKFDGTHPSIIQKEMKNIEMQIEKECIELGIK